MIRTITIAYNWWNAETGKPPLKKHEKALEELSQKRMFERINEGVRQDTMEARIRVDDKDPENGVFYKANWGVEFSDE